MHGEDVTDWKSFLNDWGLQFNNVIHIINYLNTYPLILSLLGLKDIIVPHQLESVQKDWINWFNKFTHEIDKQFFKPYWIPLIDNSYDAFIDISSGKFPVFAIHYFFFEPFRWYKEFYFDDITEVLLSPDTGFDIKKAGKKAMLKNGEKCLNSSKSAGYLLIQVNCQLKMLREMKLSQKTAARKRLKLNML